MRNSKDLLINWSKTPDEQSQEFEAFWENERIKCQEGIFIDGIFINPFLYWHTNLWTIRTDHPTKGRIMVKPYLRDNEWFLTEKIHEANNWKNENGEIRKKGVVALGTRRFSKSELQSSFSAWNAIIWRFTENVVAGGNEADIKIITDKIDFGINHLPNYFMKSKVEDNWKKQVTLGFKDAKTGERTTWSSFLIRNFDGGNNEEAIAGTTPNSLNIDEIGKYPFLKALQAGLPGLATPFGWRCSPLAMGTGGDMDNFKDAQELFDNPEAHNFLLCEIPEENRKCGIYLPGWMSYEFPKKATTLDKYLEVENAPNLSKVEILVADKEENNKLIFEKRRLAAQSSDPSALLKLTMYYPTNTREIFLTDSNNSFPIEACKQQQEELKDYSPEYIDFYRDKDNRVQWKYSSKKPINHFPVKRPDYKEAPFCMVEPPLADAPHATYIIGIDPYNEDSSSEQTVSLGAIYVYKRMYNPLGEHQNSIVGWWTGRCKSLKEFHELCLNVAEFYNAIEGVLPENEDKTLIQYFFLKKKGHFLADSFELSKQINPLTRSNRAKGLSASTTNQKHYMKLMIEDAKEEISIVDETGEEIEKLGVARIPDPMLLEEMIHYKGRTTGKGVHDGNYDRIVAFGHVLALARYYDVKYPTSYWKPKEVKDDVKKPPTIKTPWGSLTKQFNPFGNKPKKSPFKQFI